MAENKEIYCSFGVDFDAVSGWLGSYGREDSPSDISRGMFAPNSAHRARVTPAKRGQG